MNRAKAAYCRYWFCLLLTHLLWLSHFLLLPRQLVAAEVPIFYPDIKEPYLSIFKDTIRGIESNNKLSVQIRVITPDLGSLQLQTWAKQIQAPTAIVLGPSSLKALQTLPDDAQILSAIFLTEPGDLSRVAVSVTYAPDPLLLFSTMQRLDHRIKRVHVVINTTTLSKNVELRNCN